MHTPIKSPAEVARDIADGVTIVTSGFVGVGHAEACSKAIEARFLAEGRPRELTLMFSAGQGNGSDKGVNHFGHAGLVKRVIGGHWLAAPKLSALVVHDQIEAWNLPQGVITHLFRAIAGKKPGVVTSIGLHTFVDPRLDGGRLTPRTAFSVLEPRVELVRLRGQEQLFYPALPIDVALIRASTADERGNLSCEDEPFHHDLLAIAQATFNSGGQVIAQVRRVVPFGSIAPNDVRVPGIFVSALCFAEDPADHSMSFGEAFKKEYRAAPIDRLSPGNTTGHVQKLSPLAARKVIQRRALLELLTLDWPLVNLGVGAPAGIAAVAREENVHKFTLTVEAGLVGGSPADGLAFGASSFPEAAIDHAAMFDFYDGGGLDICFLGLGEFDGFGNVNVSRFADRVAGVGGFINISQSTKRVVFMGTLTTDGLRVACGQGGLSIVQEGKVRKMVPLVSHLSFNGRYAWEKGQNVTFITERAVFRLSEAGLTLVEVAPGIDVERDVLRLLAGPIKVSDKLCVMDARIFEERPMLATGSIAGDSDPRQLMGQMNSRL
jgi:propionate CoA-transferase